MSKRGQKPTRDRILEAALASFHEHGYEGSTMAAIARRAGVTAAALYHYFPGKRDLFEALGRPDLDFPSPRIEARKREILQAALFVFSQKGYAGATMDDVAQAVGVSKAALYGYFASKEHLFSSVLSTTPVMADISELLNAKTREGVSSDPEALLLWVATRFLRMYRDPDRLNLVRIVLAEGGRNPEVSAAFLTSAVERGSGLVAEALERSGFGSKARLRPMAQAWVGMLFSWVVLNRVLAAASPASPGDRPASSGHRLDREERAMAERAVRMFLHGARP
ncbi:MAG: TetR/AcrR family transcriptional regulator [Firmicutes bacterium]|nr:TetR/AcrR family transcriptional regulator [Bacillota bacterium]